MKIITKKNGIAFLAICSMVLMGFRPTETVEGFYLNGGKTKITELGCYSFEDLSAKVPILPEMHGYDYIAVNIIKYNAEKESVAYCGYSYDGPVFRSKYANKEMMDLKIFKKGEQRHCTERGELTRVDLKYTNADRGLVGAYMQIVVKGQMISGYEEEIVGNKIIKKPTYSTATTIYEGPELPLTNREKVNRFKLLTITSVDLSVPCDAAPAQK
ncbi:MAG: hypothetical protein IT236_13555 [Bacteroidia bacterium]|nr:hypothetical protein [Bacteroidia bacterium]